MRSVTLRNRKKKRSRGTCKRIRQRKSNEIVWSVKNEEVSSFMSLDDMNDVMRVVKTQRVKGKRWWKVMPKDSCEVYKERKRRDDNANDTTDDSAGQEEGEGRRNKNPRNGRKPDKEIRFRKIKKRSSDYSSTSSTTMSTMSTSASTTSSEMDYE